MRPKVTGQVFGMETSFSADIILVAHLSAESTAVLASSASNHLSTPGSWHLEALSRFGQTAQQQQLIAAPPVYQTSRTRSSTVFYTTGKAIELRGPFAPVSFAVH